MIGVRFYSILVTRKYIQNNKMQQTNKQRKNEKIEGVQNTFTTPNGFGLT